MLLSNVCWPGFTQALMWKEHLMPEELLAYGNFFLETVNEIIPCIGMRAIGAPC